MAMRRLLIPLFVIGALIAPMAASAQLVPCGTRENPEPCTFCHVFILLNNVFDLVLEIAVAASVVVLIIGSFLLMFSGANESWKAKGHQAVTATAVGFAIVLLSWVIVNTTINTIATRWSDERQPRGFPWPWNNPPSCKTEGGSCYDLCLKECRKYDIGNCTRYCQLRCD